MAIRAQGGLISSIRKVVAPCLIVSMTKSAQGAQDSHGYKYPASIFRRLQSQSVSVVQSKILTSATKNLDQMISTQEKYVTR